MYAIDENGRYAPVISDGWNVKNDALGIVWDDIREQCEAIRCQVMDKKTSPLAYHLKKSLLDISLLSAYSGVPKRKIRKHLRYEDFLRADAATLQLYAEAMRITVDELKRMDEWK